MTRAADDALGLAVVGEVEAGAGGGGEVVDVVVRRWSEVVEVADRPAAAVAARRVENASSTRSGSAYAYGFSTTACTTLKIAVVAPMPSASVSTAAIVKPGFVRHCRNANGTSCRSSSSQSRRAHGVVALPAQARELRFDARRSPTGAARARAPRADRSRVDQLPRAQLDVMGELVVHFLLDRHAPQQRSQPLANGHGYTRLDQDAIDRGGKRRPGGGMARELLPSGPREAIELGAAAELGGAPFGVEQAALLHPIERRVERPFFELEAGSVASSIHRPMA